jgi:hypothetical protein
LTAPEAGRSVWTVVGLVMSGVLAAALVSAAAANASVTEPRPVSPRGLVVQQSAMAAGGGRAAVLMAGYVRSARRQRFSLEARLGAATRLGRRQRLAAGQVFDPRVAAGDDGTVVAAWTAHPAGAREGLRVAIARPGHTFGRVQRLSRVRSGLGGVGVTATGRAVVAWRSATTGTSGTPVQIAIAEPGRRFGVAQTLGAGRGYGPALTVAPNGTVLVAWLDTPSPPPPPPAPPPPPTPARVLAATLAQDAAGFGPVAELATLTYWFGGPEAASGPGGAAVSWRQTGNEKLLVSLTTENAFAPPVALPPATYVAGEGYPDHLALGLPADAAAVALWAELRATEREGVTFAVVEDSVRPAGGSFSPATQLSSSGWLAGPPRARALADRTVAAWGETRGRHARVRIAVHRADRGWTTLRPLPSPGVDTLTIGTAAFRRRVLVAWIQRAGPGPEPGGRMYLTSYRP